MTNTNINSSYEMTGYLQYWFSFTWHRFRNFNNNMFIYKSNWIETAYVFGWKTCIQLYNGIHVQFAIYYMMCIYDIIMVCFVIAWLDGDVIIIIFFLICRTKLHLLFLKYLYILYMWKEFQFWRNRSSNRCLITHFKHSLLLKCLDSHIS
jgi:hypothetical protein